MIHIYACSFKACIFSVHHRHIMSDSLIVRLVLLHLCCQGYMNIIDFDHIWIFKQRVTLVPLEDLV